MNWQKHCEEIFQLAQAVQVTMRPQETIALDVAVEDLWKKTVALRCAKRTIYCIGNGASAAIASHFSADMAKNGRLHTEVFSDLALITAISNDLSYREVFAEPLRRRATSGDILVAISSSGNSENIVHCANCARELDLFIVTLSAMKNENALRQLGDLNFYFPAQTYGNAETLHAMMLHYWTDLFLAEK